LISPTGPVTKLPESLGVLFEFEKNIPPDFSLT
jgi:hypothetical protein